VETSPRRKSINQKQMSITSKGHDLLTEDVRYSIKGSVRIPITESIRDVLNELELEVIEKFDCGTIKKNDLDDLSDAIGRALHSDYRMTVGSLRYIFGRGKEQKYLNSLFLDEIAKSVDYKGWADFCNHVAKRDAKKEYFNPLSIDVSELPAGKEITIGWEPYYYAKLEYLGDFNFKVLICTRNFKIRKGEVIKIYGFGISYKFHLDMVEDPHDNSCIVGGYKFHPDIIFIGEKSKNIITENNGDLHVMGKHNIKEH